MTAYPDTSFLCSLYREQEHSPDADAFRDGMSDPLPFSRLLEFEFLQAIELQVWLHSQDRAKGYSRREADQMVDDWKSDVAAGLNVLVPVDSDLVLGLARELSMQRTASGGHRTLDILHVATAVHLQSDLFLTFDKRQKHLAESLGLKVPRWKKHR
jgi:predicted nucleic acid-binding protein